MTFEGWRPPVATGFEDVLVEGFPRYLREPLMSWLRDRTTDGHSGFHTERWVDFQTAVKQDLGVNVGYYEWDTFGRAWLRNLDDDTFTNLIDYALYRGAMRTGVGSAESLERILSNGSSKWQAMVIGNHWRLIERVPEGVKTVMEQVFASNHLASSKLKEAWADAYGVNPRPSVAYNNAVVAVEIIALEVVHISKPDPTLGDVIVILETQKDKWRLPFRDSAKAPRIEVLAKMMRLLWRGHASRHGRPDYTDASDEEARGAVVLAGTLVSWLVAGLLTNSE